MEIEGKKEKEALVVSVKGRIDALTAPEFEKQLGELMGKEGRTVLLNLGALEYISSAGLRSILGAAKQLKGQGGKMVFAGLQGSVKDVFKISGFGSIFTIYETREEALAQI